MKSAFVAHYFPTRLLRLNLEDLVTALAWSDYLLQSEFQRSIRRLEAPEDRRGGELRQAIEQVLLGWRNRRRFAAESQFSRCWRTAALDELIEK